jgi:plasmid stability protein
MPRTTLTLDSDVHAALERRRRSRGTSFKQEVNDLLRAGMRREEDSTSPQEHFQTAALPLGKPRIESFDDVAAVLELGEGEEHL